ncbi:MAG: DUF4349 domain-containing protein [Mitsuaria chitosanitabida]|uniref:DUF4349 domain-containing protein n=1 Tax=Roseateles chitosanitabidus TaxID=65048 RepID=UPI001B163BB7|nr:DUF4349 domain-containing protein [Roseateles chitosanitabidus]MBO9689153.1 DUF4349 domain-containing protein [Roseateles chitosanitabidus]
MNPLTLGAPMHRLLPACLLLIALTACSDRSNSAPGPMGSAAKEAVALRVAAPDAKPRTLAYDHSLQLDAPEEKVAAIHQAALGACHAAAADLCEVLDSRISTGRNATANLRFRAKPAGIQKLIATLGQQGEITNQSTQAEDLAEPLQDGEKKLAMLTAYRAELEVLRKRPGNDVDALIKVTRELAQVQSELEDASGKQANLKRRVETETLSIYIQSTHARSFWRPISLALSDFGGTLSQGISTAITAVAFLLPWFFVLGLIFWIGLTLWRRRKPR